jgi:hypothetical protein
MLHEVGLATTPNVDEVLIVAVVMSGALAITENLMAPDVGGVVGSVYERTRTEHTGMDAYEPVYRALM